MTKKHTRVFNRYQIEQTDDFVKYTDEIWAKDLDFSVIHDTGPDVWVVTYTEIVPEKMKQLNERIASLIANAVATMWCAYACLGIALIGASSVNFGVPGEVVQWVLQTTFQSVLISIILVNERVIGRKSEEENKALHDEIVAMHKEAHDKLNLIISMVE